MNKVWIERRYVDTWSINHFLFGASLAVIFKTLGISFVIGLIYALAIFIIWEIIELVASANETSTNEVLDIVSETLGFIILWQIENMWLYIGLILIYVFLETWGYVTKSIMTVHKLKRVLYIIYIPLVLIYSVFYLYLIDIF
ncbi:MAG: hypothetical protein WC705_02935 [Candidatus Paceibacterota bacterium]|jgi:hypothetical protein